MGTISVIVHTSDGGDIWTSWESLGEANLYAIDRSRDGRNVQWTKVVEAISDGFNLNLHSLLSHYAHGEMMNPDTGLPWPAIDTPLTEGFRGDRDD